MVNATIPRCHLKSFGFLVFCADQRGNQTCRLDPNLPWKNKKKSCNYHYFIVIIVKLATGLQDIEPLSLLPLATCTNLFMLFPILSLTSPRAIFDGFAISTLFRSNFATTVAQRLTMTIRTCIIALNARSNSQIDNGTFKLIHPITISHFLQIWSPETRRDGSRCALFRPVMSIAPERGGERIPIQ